MAVTLFLEEWFLLRSGTRAEHETGAPAAGEHPLPEVDGWHHTQTPSLCFPLVPGQPADRIATPWENGIYRWDSFWSVIQSRFVLHAHGRRARWNRCFLG